MNLSRCYWRIESLYRLRIHKQHIIEKHFNRTNADDIFLFYPHISLRMVFETFRAKLRAGILEGKVDHLSGRLIYYYPLDFVVGTFSIRRDWGFTLHETCFVRLVCATSRCPNRFCRRLVPTVVITIFPDGRRNLRSLIENEAYGAKVWQN